MNEIRQVEETDAEKLQAYKKSQHLDLGSDELNLKHLDLIRKMGVAYRSGNMEEYNKLEKQQTQLILGAGKPLPLMFAYKK